jgi:hypothetical protein
MNTVNPSKGWVVVCVIWLAGCASTSPLEPDWVNGSAARYKPAQFLIGRGQADSENAASDRARADLAKIFQVEIDVASQDVLSYQGATSPGATDNRTTSKISRTITTKTNQIVNGIQIAEIWHDPKTQNYYALAVLSRSQAGNDLRQEIESLDAATARYIKQSRDSDDLLLKIAAANRALDAQIDRSAYQKSLKIVDSSGIGAPAQWNVATLRSDLDELLHRMRISAAADHDPLGGLRDDLAGGLSAAGFLVDSGKDPAYVLKASLDITGPDLINDWYWMRGILLVQLINPNTGQVRGTKQWEVKTSAQQQSVAKQRTQTQVREILNHQLRETLIEFAVGGDISS